MDSQTQWSRCGTTCIRASDVLSNVLHKTSLFYRYSRHVPADIFSVPVAFPPLSNPDPHDMKWHITY